MGNPALVQARDTCQKGLQNLLHGWNNEFVLQRLLGILNTGAEWLRHKVKVLSIVIDTRMDELIQKKAGEMIRRIFISRRR